MSRALLIGVVLLSLAACSTNRALDTSSFVDGQAAAPVVTQDAAATDAQPMNGAPMSGGDIPRSDSGVGGACAATCGTPAGPVAELSDAEATAAMTGQWQICSGRDIWAMLGAPSDTVGIEYTLDGHMYYLIAGANGPVRGAGFAYQLTYDVSGQQLDMHPAPNAGFFGFLDFSPCPREIHIASLAYNEAGSTLVPFADANPPTTGDPMNHPSCAATCATPAGTVTPLPTVGDVYSTFEGRWLICQGLQGWQVVGAPSDVVGIEFGPGSSTPAANGTTEGGNMYYLVDVAGSVVRGAGSQYQLTYDVTPLGSSYQLNMHPAPHSGFGTSFRYSPCPRELELNGVGGPSSVVIPAP
jgi:hypothetical protein